MKLILGQWQVAYRKRPLGSILTDKETPFISIPNTMRYTAADPFLFNYNGVKYLFAELYDKNDGLGKLGYSVYDGDGFGEWKVIISEPYHLSYPNIFEYDGGIYIVPEANESNTIYAYKAVEFPDKWEKCGILLDNCKCVDTTFLSCGDKELMFTYDIADQQNKKLWIYSVGKDKTELLIDTPVSTDDASARHGGNFIEYNGDIIRVSQDCDGDYGKALVFSKILKCDKTGYEEQTVQHIAPENVVIDKKKVSGMHTYNGDSDIEVIDFHILDYGLYTQFCRIKRKLR